MKSIEQRLADLETNNCRWKKLSLALAGSMLAVTCVAAATPTFIPDVIYGRRFEVVNEQGKTVAVVGQSNGNAELKLFNQAGQLQFAVSGTDRGGLMSLWNGDSQLLRAGNNGLGGTMDIMTAAGNEAARIGAASGQNGYIGVASVNGGLRSVTTPIVAAPQFVPQATTQPARRPMVSR